MMQQFNDIIKLKNAPLKEVIFEIHWDLDVMPEQNMSVDTGFETAVLNFRNACQQDFKIVELLTPPMIPAVVFNNKVTHRFFKEKDRYPLYQLGPGVFTVNDNNKNYSWTEFRTLILSGINCLQSSYEKKIVISKIELRYIDSVSINTFGTVNKFEFLKHHLQVNPEPYPFVDGELDSINFTKKFIIDEEIMLNIMVATAFDIKSNDEVAIWHTFINNRKRIHESNLETWIDKAHEIASSTFKKMISKQLYGYFNN